MTTTVRYHTTAERPSLALWLFDDDGTLIDLSTGYTFEFKVGIVGTAALLTKTSGMTGATGAGIEPTGTPNLSIAWSAGELDIAPGQYVWQLKATTGGADRLFTGLFQVADVIA